MEVQASVGDRTMEQVSGVPGICGNDRSNPISRSWWRRGGAYQ
jgi:hypothetical protein